MVTMLSSIFFSKSNAYRKYIVRRFIK